MSTQATETPMRLTIDLSKPKGERETIAPMSVEELSQAKKDSADYAERKAVEDKEQEARDSAKQSANDKLAALGLTAEEILAITGA